MSRPVKIELTQGYVALVDAEDAEKINQYLWNACKYREGKVIATNAKLGSMHRWLMKAAPGVDIDHKDGNQLNNCKKNLRIATSSQNNANRKKMKREGKSKYKGVSPTGRVKNAWKAAIVKDKKHIALGAFKTEEEAARRYDTEAAKLFGEFASLNFPSEMKQALKRVYPPTRKRRSAPRPPLPRS